ncbi:SufS family cysteine desulfurase [Candidatus Woesearchaeota archaeon]|nr:MAG: SufS family cysteine desulfurase [Candidatus Woesearchaeota archaeon]
MKKKQEFDIEKIRKDFPVLKNTAYLDSGATSLTPKPVVEAIKEYYLNYNANVHRAIHKLGEKATLEYEEARRKIADFINAEPEEIIFTKSTTESLNLLAYSLTRDFGRKVILSELEHHSNLVPWQQLGKASYAKTQNGRVNTEHLKELLRNSDAKIVSVTQMSNVTGGINDLKEISRITHNKNALLVVDGAQGVPHLGINVKDDDVDFLAFSGHKMLGPTGVGVLYGKKELLARISPFLYGGDMISEVSFKDSKWNDIPWKFEAGTPPIASAIGLGKAIDYINNIGIKRIRRHIDALKDYALEQMKKIEGIKIYSNGDSGIISFNIKGVHPHDVSTIMSRCNVAIRTGHLCAMPFIKSVLKESSVCRISIYLYNTKEDIDKAVAAIKKVKEVFK